MSLRALIDRLSLVSAQALACSCPDLSLAESMRAAHVAFSGRVICSIQVPNVLRMRMEDRLIVDVERVWSDGTVFSKTVVNPGEPPCMSLLSEGGSYLFFGDARDGVMVFDRCSGTRPLAHGQELDARSRSPAPFWPIVFGVAVVLALTVLAILRAIRRRNRPLAVS